jgi:hypothetical protein
MPTHCLHQNPPLSAKARSAAVPGTHEHERIWMWLRSDVTD